MLLLELVLELELVLVLELELGLVPGVMGELVHRDGGVTVAKMW